MLLLTSQQIKDYVELVINSSKDEFDNSSNKLSFANFALLENHSTYRFLYALMYAINNLSDLAKLDKGEILIKYLNALTNTQLNFLTCWMSGLKILTVSGLQSLSVRGLRYC